MFFGKKMQRSPVTQASGWLDSGRKRQQLRLGVERFQYSVSGSYGHWALEVDVKAKAGPLADLKIAVTVEVLDPFEAPKHLSEQWGSYPETVEGICRYQQLDSPFHPDGFNVNLYCQAKAADSILKMLTVASGQNVSAVLDLEISSQGNKSGEFWLSGWREEELRVLTWRFIVESRFGQDS